MKRPTVVASEESLRSPSIPPIRFDFNDKPRRPVVDDSPYIAPFSSHDNYSCERGSEDLARKTGVYTTDEENSLFADVNSSVETHMAQRECHDDSIQAALVPSAGVPSVPRTGLYNHLSTQPQSSSRTPRHGPAFDVYKAASSVEEREHEKMYVVRMKHAVRASHHMAEMNELYERERNLWFQHRDSNRKCQEMSRCILNPPVQKMSFQRDSNGQCQEMSSSRQSLQNRPLSDMGTNRPSSNLHSHQNATMRSSTLSNDEKAYLRLIRNFAYMHREPNVHGFRTLENVTNLLPPKSMDYWLQLIQSHLQEVEIDTFRNTVR